MLFRQHFLNGIREGTIKVAFRRWRRPSVRTGGKLLTAAGELAIKAVTTVSLDEISAADARSAGYESREALLAELNLRTEGSIYRIELGQLHADPRIALRNSSVDGEELRQLLERLNRLNVRAEGPPWTLRVLKLLRDRPGVRAGDLCRLVGQEKAQFKLNVRKLKNLGLTESLETGYRLSPRGEALLRATELEASVKSRT